MDDRDLTVFYTATRTWIEGANPYDGHVLADLAAQLGFRHAPSWSLNPPMTFVLLAPLGLLPWPVVEKVSVIVNVLLVVGCVALAMRLADLRLREPRGLLFLAFAIALAPFHTAISEGQLSIATTLLIVASLAAAEHDQPVLSGASIALAVALKPQMALVFVLLILLRGHWRALAAAASVLLVLGVVAVARMASAGVSWIPTLAANLVGSGTGDPSVPTTQRLNLYVLLNEMLRGQDPIALEVITIGAGLVAGAVLFVALRRRADREANLLLYAGCSVLTLLTLYNRSYGATLLILPLAWALARFRPAALRPVAAVVAASIAVFLVPGAAALARSEVPDAILWVTDTPWWPYLQMHQVIALLVVLAALLVAATHGVRVPFRRQREAPGFLQRPR